MLCSAKVSKTRKEDFMALSSMKCNSNLGKYLVVKLDMERSKNISFTIFWSVLNIACPLGR